MLSRYERFEPIGRGGMGVVFRAVDSQLQRPVALKFLAAGADGELRERFLREARLAAALNHPGICTIYEVGEVAPGEESLLGPDHPLLPGTPVLAMELLAGRTLEDELRRSGALSPTRMLALSLPIAEALAAAHVRRVVHRDLKPANVMILPDGRVKLLDFGLARPAPAEFPGAPTDDGATVAAVPEGLTMEGRILGTIAYMSPEQARGEAVDSRSDVFSFGVVLYEMATGKRPFEGSSPVSTLAKILETEPTPVASLRAEIPADLARLIRRCLRKAPDERFNDTRDLAAALRELQAELAVGSGEATGTVGGAGAGDLKAAAGSSTPGSPVPGGSPSTNSSVNHSAPAWPSVAAFPSGETAAAQPDPAHPSALTIQPTVVRLPSFRRLTFARGTIDSARFAPGGVSAIYSARWRGEPLGIYTVRPESPESRPAGLSDARLLAVSRSEELAIQREPYLMLSAEHGCLARAPLGGGGVRDVLERVQEAEFAPDGRSLAILRLEGIRWNLEFPIGNVLYQSRSPLQGLRMSPDGSRFAVGEWADPHQEGTVRIIERDGSHRPLAGGPSHVTGGAWSPDGSALCLSAREPGGQSSLWLVSLEGERRILWRGAGTMRLHDCAPDGRLLVSTQHTERLVHARPPGSASEVELSWLDASLIKDITADGRAVLLAELGVGGGDGGSLYVRPTSGGPAIRVAEGDSNSFGEDGGSILVIPPDDTTRLDLVPTGAGFTRSFRLEASLRAQGAWVHPGNRHALVMRDQRGGRAIGLCVVDLESGTVVREFPEGTAIWSGQHPVSPDGRFLALLSQTPAGAQNVVFPVDEGDGVPVPGLGPKDIVSGWAGDSTGLYVHNREGLPATVERVEVATGRREPVLSLMPQDAAGVRGLRCVRVAWNGEGYVYDFTRVLSELYVVDWRD